MTSQGDRLGIIIFGASGFTGKVAVYEIVKLAKEKNVTWGIAGRSKNKLDDVLREVEERTGENLSSIPIVIADVKDESSMKQMAAQARVVVNCVGPYRFFGETVVKACIESGAHHVDVSGEPQYMERMQLDYHKAAEEKGVYVVSACGFDSIPADMGTLFLTNKFQGTVNSVETYLQLDYLKPVKGAHLHYTTYESMVYGMANMHELRPLREKLFPNRLPNFTPKLKPRSKIHKRENVGWCIPFLGSDRAVILRSQRHFFESDKQRPIQVQTYVGFKSLWYIFVMSIFGMFMALLCKSEFGRKILLKNPGLFSGGYVTHEGPSEETRENTVFKIDLFGEGWSEKLTEPTDEFSTPPNKQMAVRVSGKNPGYGLTTIMILLSAITILKESDKMPSRGGVYPPAAAFAKTSILEELDKHGLKFEVLSTSEQ